MPQATEKTYASRWTPTLIIVLVAAATILSISMGLRQSLGLFMEPMVRAATVSVATFGFAMAVQSLIWERTLGRAGHGARLYRGHRGSTPLQARSECLPFAINAHE